MANVPPAAPPDPEPQSPPRLPLLLDPEVKDATLRAWLQRTPAPTGDEDPTWIRARMRVSKERVREVQETMDMIAPRSSYVIQSLYARQAFLYSCLVWSIFPVNHLPPEILSEIFRHVAWNTYGWKEGVKQRLRLTWVCKHWRAVALEDKPLWNPILFSQPSAFPVSFAMMSRVGRAPLDLRIEDIPPQDGDPSRRPSPDHNPIFSLLGHILRKEDQLRSVALILHDWATTDAIVRKLQTAKSPHALRRFELHRLGRPTLLEWRPPDYSPALLWGGNAINLEALCLDGITIDWDELPTDKLRALDLRRIAPPLGPSLSRWHELLSHNLVRLALTSAGPDLFGAAEQGDAIPQFDLSRLRELHLQDLNVRYAQLIIARIRAPGLISLVLNNIPGQYYGLFLQTLTGRFRELKLLTTFGLNLEASPENTRLVVRWLDTMPNLRMLKFAHVPSEFPEALLQDPRRFRSTLRGDAHEEPDPSSPRQILCPALDTIYFHFQDPGSVFGLLQGRHDLGVRFERVWIPQPLVMMIAPEMLKLMSTLVGNIFVTGSLPKDEQNYRTEVFHLLPYA
ncbi:hypothetical protein OBBRIDRAFT_788946 [Obba rivulosa]|uniref:F-box domain-containing protein n=1 Tax=Obba rivulosa TaxID=1052685 RepID=A0A8E2DS55_9APHY|nr:hypothetical protein OBBRIDRAFT_788946 [Obba rivulosa]